MVEPNHAAVAKNPAYGPATETPAKMRGFPSASSLTPAPKSAQAVGWAGTAGRSYCWKQGVTDTVLLREPVKFEPPPPRAPPMTDFLKVSGVPAWSEFF
jgi:hypothetical protein